MNRLERLQQQMELATAALEAKTGEGFAASLARTSLLSHVDDLKSLIREERLRWSKDVLEVHLDGLVARDGSIPLRLLATIGLKLSNAIHQSSKYLRTGKTRGRVPEEIVREMDLRLAGLQAASTRLLISGNSAPNLFGQSLLETSLRQTFDLLSADAEDALTQSVAAVGSSAAKAVQHLLKVVAMADLSIDLRWTDPTEHDHKWSATPEHLRRLVASLEDITSLDPNEVTVTGRAIMLSLRGQFEIESDAREVYRGLVATDLLEKLQRFHVGQTVLALVRDERVRNRITGEERSSLTLLDINEA